MKDNNKSNINNNNTLLLQVKELFAKLTDYERIDVISDYCIHCGSNDSACSCCNDE